MLAKNNAWWIFIGTESYLLWTFAVLAHHRTLYLPSLFIPFPIHGVTWSQEGGEAQIQVWFMGKQHFPNLNNSLGCCGKMRVHFRSIRRVRVPRALLLRLEWRSNKILGLLCLTGKHRNETSITGIGRAESWSWRNQGSGKIMGDSASGLSSMLEISDATGTYPFPVVTIKYTGRK